MSEHQLERQTWASEYEIYELSSDGGLEVTETEGRGPVRSEPELECSCGRTFEEQELAAEHLRSVQEDTHHE